MSDDAKDWKLRAERLWQLLDDIDTLDDAAKTDGEAYRRGVRRIHRERTRYAESEDGYTLTWKPLDDTHEETAWESMARVLNSMRPDDE